MNVRQILNVLGEVEDTYIEALFAEEEKPVRRVKNVWLIAALVAVMLLLVGCTVVYVFRMQDLKVGEDSNTKYYNGQNQRIEPTEVNRTVITLHGLEGSATYRAAREWYAFREEYDKRPYEERVPLDAVPEAYQAYNAYTQELVDKIDEICKKYGLKLLGPSVTVQQWESERFQELLGFEGILVKDSSAKILSLSGYCYQGGNFKAEFSMRMPQAEGQWPHKMLNTMYYSKPDYFDDVYSYIEDMEQCTQWEYTTASGNRVLIMVAADGYGARVFCNRKDALISARIENYCNKKYSPGTNSYEETEFMSKVQLEQVVDQIDFSLGVPEEVKVKETDPYAAYIREQIKQDEAARDYEYTLLDLDGDGVAELITRDRKVNLNGVDRLLLNIHTLRDGALQKMEGEYRDSFTHICEGGILEYADLDSDDGQNRGYYEYFRYTEEGIEAIETVFWMPDWKSWAHKHPRHAGSLVSEEHAMALIQAYKRMELDMKPFSAYPAEGMR